jgi:hypothetical protein
MDYNDQLNVAQAAKACGVAEMTIRKYLGITNPPQPSQLPNARKELRKGKSVWVIPITDLVAAGLMDKVIGSNAKAEATTAPATEALLRQEIDSLKALLAEKDRIIALYDQQLTIANRLQLAFSAQPEQPDTNQVQEARRRFWRK